MTDETFFREQTIKLIREAGANEARLNAHGDAIARIETAVKDGFAHQEIRTAEQINHIRGEIKTMGEAAKAQREADLESITLALDEVKQDRASFNRSLSRVGWAIIAAVVAAAAAQTALSPQAAEIAARAIGQAP